MKQLTKEQAIELGNTKWWGHVNTASIAAFQLTQEMLCCPIEVYVNALSGTLGRNVYTHELDKPELLIREMNREIKTPSVDEIIAMLPYDKTAVIKRS
ncbi:hypothetical protein [Pseudoalteromonas sp. ASV78]|uniref:DUF7736 domain-containing protein n=1 Tax=Pseudoalteromonas sp. ASV78 TaxID=3397851 RepID=UPI0039FC6AE1